MLDVEKRKIALQGALILCDVATAHRGIVGRSPSLIARGRDRRGIRDTLPVGVGVCGARSSTGKPSAATFRRPGLVGVGGGHVKKDDGTTGTFVQNGLLAGAVRPRRADTAEFAAADRRPGRDFGLSEDVFPNFVDSIY